MRISVLLIVLVGVAMVRMVNGGSDQNDAATPIQLGAISAKQREHTSSMCDTKPAANLTRFRRANSRKE